MRHETWTRRLAPFLRRRWEEQEKEERLYAAWRALPESITITQREVVDYISRDNFIPTQSRTLFPKPERELLGMLGRTAVYIETAG